jgi:competence protein ComGC
VGGVGKPLRALRLCCAFGSLNQLVAAVTVAICECAVIVVPTRVTVLPFLLHSSLRSLHHICVTARLCLLFVPQIKKIDAHSVSITITFCVQFVKSTMMKYFIESNTTPEVQKWQEAYFKHLKKVRDTGYAVHVLYNVKRRVMCVDSVVGVNCSGGAAVVNTVACNVVSMWVVVMRRPRGQLVCC